MADTGVTAHSLNRILFHLSEDQQSRQPRYRVHNGCFAARAQARVIVQRALRQAELAISTAWECAKE